MNSYRISALVLFISCLPLVEGCLFSGREESHSARPGNPGTAKARLLLTPAALVKGESTAPSIVDSVHIRITAEDISPLEFSFSGDSLVFDLQELPVGTGRMVNADLFRGGRLLYSGKGTFAFRREARAEVALRCDPQFSRVTARFHLPLGLPMPIADGSLRLSGKPGEYMAALRKQGEFGSFIVDEIPGDIRYDVAMALADGAGKTRYEANREGVFLALGEEAKWDLSLLPTEAQAGVALSLAAVKVNFFDPVFPSRARRPGKFGEAVISEFYAAPTDKDSSTAGEWFEVFNRTADTLSLAGCRISRDRSGGATRSLPFDSTQVLLPGQAVTFGRSAAVTNVHYPDFTMVNTAATMLMLCRGDSLVVDSLRYSSTPTDSLAPELRPLPIKDGWVTTLNADSLGISASAKSWCLTKSSSEGTGSGFATPGRVEGCAE